MVCYGNILLLPQKKLKKNYGNFLPVKKMKDFHHFFLPVKKDVFRKLPVQKTVRSWLSPRG